MKKTVVVYGSSTGTCQSIAETIASKLGVEALDVTNFNADVVAENDNLLIGTSTWGAGELQDDWYDGVKVLKEADLAGKTVAVFGCGDAESSAEQWPNYTMQQKKAAQRWLAKCLPKTILSTIAKLL